MEGITTREAIKKLSEGVEISIEDEHSIASEIFRKGHEINPTLEISRVLIELSNICNSFLSSVNYDENECARVDSLWKAVDDNLRDYDFESIENIRKAVGGIILKRKDKLREIEKQNRKNKYAN